MKKNGVITIVGSIIYDYRIMADKLPSPGETILGYGFGCCSGGKGANQAVAAACLGADVSIVGCVGDDYNGDLIISEYKTHGINAEFVASLPGVPTSTCLIHIEKGGQNAIIIDCTANNLLSSAHVDNARDLLNQTGVLLLQNEVPMETSIHAATIAREAGAVIIYNPAPALQLNETMLKLTDYFTPNETETEFYTGVKINGIPDASTAADILLKKGLKNIIITMGKDGSYYASGDYKKHFPAYPITAVDATAAGDAFNGALAVMLSEGRDIEYTVKFANAAGAVCAQGAGSQSSLGNREDVELLMSKH